MKKLLLIAALMALGTTALAGGDYERPCPDCLPDDEIQAYVPVEACVYYPLTLALERGLDFGNIEAGTKATVFPKKTDPGSAKVIVNGQAGADVKIAWEDDVFIRHIKKYSEKIKVKNIVAREKGEGLISNPGTFSLEQFGGGYLGKETLFIGGEIGAAQTANAKPGKYTGSVRVTLAYE